MEISIAIKISIIAIVYILILQHEKPFNKWFSFGYKYFRDTFIYKPVFSCEKCFAGQIALWKYLAEVFYFKTIKYNFFEHIYFVSITILITFFLAQLYKKIE